MRDADDWRRERNWDPTFSEFVAANLPGEEALKSNCHVENTGENPNSITD
jgi:hypothetical protein